MKAPDSVYLCLATTSSQVQDALMTARHGRYIHSRAGWYQLLNLLLGDWVSGSPKVGCSTHTLYKLSVVMLRHGGNSVKLCSAVLSYPSFRGRHYPPWRNIKLITNL